MSIKIVNKFGCFSVVYVAISFSFIAHTTGNPLVQVVDKSLKIDAEVEKLVPKLILFNDMTYARGKYGIEKYNNYLTYFTSKQNWKVHSITGFTGKEIATSAYDAPVIVAYNASNGTMVICFRGSQALQGESIFKAKDWETNLSLKVASWKEVINSYSFTDGVKPVEEMVPFKETNELALARAGQKYVENLMFHQGFAFRVWRSLPIILAFVEKYQPTKVIVTGHSQGAALATIALAALVSAEKARNSEFNNAQANKYVGYSFSTPRSIYTLQSATRYESIVGKHNVVYQNCENDPVPHFYFARKSGWMDVGYRALDKANNVSSRRSETAKEDIVKALKLSSAGGLAYVHYGSYISPMNSYLRYLAINSQGKIEIPNAELIFDPVLADSSGAVAAQLETIIPSYFWSYLKVNKNSLESIDQLLKNGQQDTQFWSPPQ